MLETFIGGFAAFCTTVSYIPQVKKAWATHETGDLSLKMLLILSAGLALWILYGFLKGDWVIILANGVSLAMLANLVWFKMHEKSGQGG
jgi:MtN3 and saliva related transmembrane protein